MDEKLEYENMLDIPINTSSITKATKKRKLFKKKKVDAEQVKSKLINKINSGQDEDVATCFNTPQECCADACAVQCFDDENYCENQSSIITNQKDCAKKQKGKFKVSFLTVQIMIIGALIATIFITNSVYPNSAINVFMRGVLGTQQDEMVDNREYNDFTPVISVGGSNVVLDDGVMTITGKGSVYACCNGKVSSLTLCEDGKYNMEISHSTNFKSLVSGLDYAYCQVGDSIYTNIPVGYVDQAVNMCFKGVDGLLIDQYTIQDNIVVWAV